MDARKSSDELAEQKETSVKDKLKLIWDLVKHLDFVAAYNESLHVNIDLLEKPDQLSLLRARVKCCQQIAFYYKPHNKLEFHCARMNAAKWAYQIIARNLNDNYPTTKLYYFALAYTYVIETGSIAILRSYEKELAQNLRMFNKPGVAFRSPRMIDYGFNLLLEEYPLSPALHYAYCCFTLLTNKASKAPAAAIENALRSCLFDSYIIYLNKHFTFLKTTYQNDPQAVIQSARIDCVLNHLPSAFKQIKQTNTFNGHRALFFQAKPKDITPQLAALDLANVRMGV